MADLIVLGGCAAVEAAAAEAGVDIKVPFTPGRTDASAEITDEASFAFLRPMTDGFRNYIADEHYRRPEVELLDRANQLTLTAPEMTALVGGLRTLGANFADSRHGVFSEQTGVLTNEWFVNLLSMDTAWQKSEEGKYLYEGRDRASGELRYTATSVDLIFGSNSQLRALAEVYASSDGKEKFINDFAAAWNKVMMLDRFELKGSSQARMR